MCKNVLPIHRAHREDSIRRTPDSPERERGGGGAGAGLRNRLLAHAQGYSPRAVTIAGYRESRVQSTLCRFGFALQERTGAASGTCLLAEYVGRVVPGNTRRNLPDVVTGRYTFYLEAIMFGMERMTGDAEPSPASDHSIVVRATGWREGFDRGSHSLSRRTR